MEKADLEKYKSKWKEEKIFNRKILSEAEIRKYLGKRSSGLTKSYKTGLIVDIGLKIILAASFLFIAVLFSKSIGLLILALIAFLIIIRLLFFQVSTYRIIPGQTEYSENIRTFLEAIIRFYRGRYLKSVYIAALSNPFLFIGGVVIYFYFRYGEIRTLQLDDYLVLSLLALFGFILSALVQIRHYNLQISQLESCLKDLDENRINEKTLRKNINRRIRNILTWILFLVSGLLVLFYLLKR